MAKHSYYSASKTWEASLQCGQGILAYWTPQYSRKAFFHISHSCHLLPYRKAPLPMQFSRHPGHCTTDTMHIVTQKIKDTWRQKKVASILFLDIQATFPSTVKERLLHNMRNRQVTSTYIKLINNMLSNRRTQLSFDNFTSKTISITNSTTQGCPLSM